MSDRDKILTRIREALTLPAPRPGDHGAGEHAEVGHSHGAGPAAQAREWLPDAGDSFDEQLAVFRANAAALRTTVIEVQDRDELADQLRSLCGTEQWRKIASHSGPLTDAATASLSLPVCRTDAGYAVEDLESCDAGITECDAVIAQTGSVLVTSRSAGGRALSVLPPHHVVLARRDQLLRDLPAAFDLLKSKYGSDYPSMISFITGPSRTGDIERILVLGAHGPKKLTIFLCPD